MELLQLKYFKTVAEKGKISDAAQALFVSAPALSTSISKLEKDLGMLLFERSNNRITLNQQGQIFLRYVNQIFSDLECAQTELRQSVMRRGRYISLASVASTHLVDMIAAFSEAYPQFTLQCTSISRLEIANSGVSAQYSFLLAAEEDVPEYYTDRLDSEFLYEDKPVLMVHPDHPLAKKESVDLRELQQESIFLPMRDFPLYDHLVQLFGSCGLPFPAGNAYSHLTTQRLVDKGLGVAFASKYTGRTPGLTLQYIPISNETRPWVSRLYWRKGREFTPDERIFYDFVVNYYQNGQL